MRALQLLFLIPLFLFSCKLHQKSSTKSDSTFDSTQTKKPIIDTIKISSSPVLIHNTYGDYLNDEPDARDTSIFSYGSINNLNYCGVVFLKEKDFTGDDIPFVCFVSKNVKSLYLNKKLIHFQPEQEFFFRQKIKLYGGYNRIPIKIINNKNEETNSFIEIDIVSSQ